MPEPQVPEPQGPEPQGPDPAGHDRAATMTFRLTASQGRRRRIGFMGGAAIIWAIGLVRLVVTDRLSPGHWVLPLVLLAAVLALGAALLAAMAPVVVVTDAALAARNGPRRSTIARDDITAVDIRERGTARRVVVHHGGRHTVLPVPLTGGSLLGPGSDPALDHKLELLRGWWRDGSRP